LFFLEQGIVYDHVRKHAINKIIHQTLLKRLKLASTTNVFVETIAWTPRTLKTELGRKRYGSKKLQGLDCKKTWLLGAYLQESRDLDIITHINQRFIV
jgi:hypothetical protein